ncbi:MAG: hypothetical protein JO157_07070 [Acetobacteraceae bacterium]|nr:hypothetical protein [Acetobacteraceae bacterium]
MEAVEGADWPTTGDCGGGTEAPWAEAGPPGWPWVAAGSGTAGAAPAGREPGWTGPLGGRPWKKCVSARTGSSATFWSSPAAGTALSNH